MLKYAHWLVAGIVFIVLVVTLITLSDVTAMSGEDLEKPAITETG